MFEPVSMTIGVFLTHGALSACTRSSASSSEAAEIAWAAVGITRAVEDSQALFGEKAAALAALEEIAVECGEPDWDSHGACSIDPAALDNARDFIRALPDGMPMPELAPEPDGGISLDWVHSRHRMLSLSTGPRPRLAVAWLDGPNSGHAVESFDGVVIPELVLLKIRSTMGNDNAAIRFA
jgi:hypothetical protein